MPKIKEKEASKGKAVRDNEDGTYDPELERTVDAKDGVRTTRAIRA